MLAVAGRRRVERRSRKAIVLAWFEVLDRRGDRDLLLVVLDAVPVGHLRARDVGDRPRSRPTSRPRRRPPRRGSAGPRRSRSRSSPTSTCSRSRAASSTARTSACTATSCRGATSGSRRCTASAGSSRCSRSPRCCSTAETSCEARGRCVDRRDRARRRSGALALRVVLEGRAALAEGDEALPRSAPPTRSPRGRPPRAGTCPVAPHVDEAYARLVRLAETEPRHALAAWRAVRARRARATRSLWTPHDDDLAAAERRDRRAVRRRSRGRARRRPGPRRRAPRGTRPSSRAIRARGPPRRRSPILGIAAWLAGIGVLVRRGLDREGRLVRRPALAAAVVTLGGLAAWAVYT